MDHVQQCKEERLCAAHIRRDESGQKVEKVQSIEEHNKNVAELAEKFAGVFGMGEVAAQCGYAHDLGKYSEAFQKRIWENGPKTDHSTRGAAELLKVNARQGLDMENLRRALAMRNYSDAGVLAAYCTAGHHGGLPDGGDRSGMEGTLSGRYGKALKLSWSVPAEKLKPLTLPALQEVENPAFQFSILTRMVFSSLVDADFLDTECFMKGEERAREFSYSLPLLKEKLNQYIEQKGYLKGLEILNREEKSEKEELKGEGKEILNGVRSRILSRCIEYGRSADPGMFTLTVPTGGGKTVASLAFALEHAVQQGKDRIIYVIPYCSIIDQTVNTFKEILGEDQVLAHYSEAKEEDGEETENQRKLACENWDAPVVVTTAVQFFESLFSNRTSACRKLHRMANSVIIFDEAQTIPVDFLLPCTAAIAELVLDFRSSCVLCTATQPALEPLMKKYANQLQVREICEEEKKYFGIFKRVTYRKLGEVTDEELVGKMLGMERVLCIVSTRKQARNLYEMMPKEGTFHLSTLMVPKHRKRVLEEIRRRVREKKICRVISTSLIEAGVDLDFPIVFRSYAGLDSEIQAAGRCNRENMLSREEAIVYLFQPEEKYSRVPASMAMPRETAKSCTEGTEEIDAPEIISRYFQMLYMYKGKGLDSRDIMSMLEENFDSDRRVDFPWISEKFKLIDNQSWTVFVPYDEEGRRLETELQNNLQHLDRESFRRMGPYCVNVFEHQYRELSGSLLVIGEKLAVLTNPELYDANAGLAFTDEGGAGMFYS